MLKHAALAIEAQNTVAHACHEVSFRGHGYVSSRTRRHRGTSLIKGGALQPLPVVDSRVAVEVRVGVVELLKVI